MIDACFLIGKKKYSLRSLEKKKKSIHIEHILCQFLIIGFLFRFRTKRTSVWCRTTIAESHTATVTLGSCKFWCSTLEEHTWVIIKDKIIYTYMYTYMEKNSLELPNVRENNYHILFINLFLKNIKYENYEIRMF